MDDKLQITPNFHPPLEPCPLCGQQVRLEITGREQSVMYGNLTWWGIKCYSTKNRGGSCCLQVVPSASADACIDRWNMRGGHPPAVTALMWLDLERAKALVEASKASRKAQEERLETYRKRKPK